MRAWIGTGGALVTDAEIPKITQKLDNDASAYYGAQFFIAESMSEVAAERISVCLGLDYCGPKPMVTRRP